MTTALKSRQFMLVVNSCRNLFDWSFVFKKKEYKPHPMDYKSLKQEIDTKPGLVSLDDITLVEERLKRCHSDFLIRLHQNLKSSDFRCLTKSERIEFLISKKIVLSRS